MSVPLNSSMLVIGVPLAVVNLTYGWFVLTVTVHFGLLFLFIHPLYFESYVKFPWILTLNLTGVDPSCCLNGTPLISSPSLEVPPVVLVGVLGGFVPQPLPVQVGLPPPPHFEVVAPFFSTYIVKLVLTPLCAVAVITVFPTLSPFISPV